MTFWGSIFIGRYRQEEARWILRWGVKDVAQFSTEVLSTYEPKREGTLRQSVKHAFALLIQIAVVILIFTLTWMTKDIGSLLPGSLGTERYEGFALTAQILIVDWLWNIVGPKLAALENHRTTMLQKRDEIMKTFYVKLINTFLPFMLIAFVKRFMESCEVDESNKES